MNDKHFHEMDEAWMKTTKALREKEVSEGMLKGFSASVERRITAADEKAPQRAPALRPAWVPMLAILVLASVVVLRSPIVPSTYLAPAGSSMELAQAVSEEELQLQEEMEVLHELGVWDEYEEGALTEEELLNDPALELTSRQASSAALV